VADLQNLGVGEAIIRADRSDNDCNITTFLLPGVPENAEQIKDNIVAHTRSNYSSQTNVDEVFNYGGNDTDEKAEPKQKQSKEPPKPKETPQSEPKIEVKKKLKHYLKQKHHHKSNPSKT